MKNKIITTLLLVALFGLPVSYSGAVAAEFYKNMESNSVDPYDYTRIATQELSSPMKTIEEPIDRGVLQSQMQKELTEISRNYAQMPSALAPKHITIITGGGGHGEKD